MSSRCSGIFLEPSDHVRLGGNPEGRELAVRCCSDTELPGFRKFSGEDTCPYAGTEIDGQCYKEVNYQDAVRLCSSIGARLCTKDELERRCTFGTGCDYNNLQIWTRTSGASGYFLPDDNSFKIVNTGTGDSDIQTTFSCRGGMTGATSMAILTYDETSCAAQCIFRIPWTQYRNHCNENPEGSFAFTIPGPFPTGTDLYIGNAAGRVANSFGLECEGQLSVSFQ